MRKLIVVLATVTMCSLSLVDTPREKAEDRLERAAEVVQQIMSARDKGIPEEVIRNAKCIAVIPHEIRAGFIFGARAGRGVATHVARKMDGVLPHSSQSQEEASAYRSASKE
jgi:lipid-binding SYLF domain-containing protein